MGVTVRGRVFAASAVCDFGTIEVTGTDELKTPRKQLWDKKREKPALTQHVFTIIEEDKGSAFQRAVNKVRIDLTSCAICFAV